MTIDHHHHHPGEGHPPASISPSILRLSAVERLAAAGGADRADLGGGVLGHAREPKSERAMTAALRFNNLTLGYDRHPAVHHLDGASIPAR